MASVAVVVGAGRSVWADLQAVRALVVSPTVFAVNYMALLLPAVDHVVSHHQDEVAHLVALRARGTTEGRKLPMLTHSSSYSPGVDRVWPQFRGGRSGSSSLLAVRIALELGHPSVIVAGVPLNADGYVWDAPGTRTSGIDYAKYRLGWQDCRAAFAGRVTAVSGYLAELLGRPASVGSLVEAVA